MGFKKIAVPVLLMMAFASAQAAQAFDLGLMIGGNWGSQNSSPAPSTNSAAFGIGFGAYSEWSVLPSLIAVDLDVLYVNNVENNAIGTSSTNFNSIDIPLIVRFTGLPIVAPGVGLMFSDFVGNLNQNPNNGTSTSSSFSNFGLSTTNLSIVLSLGAKYALGGGLNVIAQFDYDLGMTDLNSPSVTGASNKLNNLMLLAGVSYGL